MKWGCRSSSPVSFSKSTSFSFACVHVVDAHTLLTANVAAPVENAVALFFALLSPGVVSAATAQKVAALNAMRGHVADPVSSPKRARLWVWLTEVGRALVVNKVTLGGMLVEGILDPQSLHPATRLTVLLHHHL